jgi:hypothetical protein
MFSCALAVCSALTAKACSWFNPNQAQALAASQTRKVLTSRAQFLKEGAPSFENSGRGAQNMISSSWDRGKCK